MARAVIEMRVAEDAKRALALTIAAAETIATRNHWNGHRTHGDDATQILTTADRLYTWLATPAPVTRLVGHIGPPTPIPEGPPMSNPQVPVGYSVAITIEPEDAQGNAVSDNLTWTSSDTAAAPVTADSTTLIGTVQVLTPAVGIVVTATDGTNSYQYTFDGVVDSPVTLVGTVGIPFKTPPAAPAA